MFDLVDKVVVITGASSGIGAALAQGFSQAGARVAVTARRLRLLHDVARTCPGDSLILPGNLIRGEVREAVVRRTLKRWGRIDILVNNAGLGIYRDFVETTEADWRQIFEINLFATVFLTLTVLPVMLAQRRGLVVNVASIGGLVAHAEKVTPYVASKHAVVGFSRGLSRDLKGTGIRILAVCPHLTDTEFFTVSPGAQEMSSVVEKFRESMDTPAAVAQGIMNHLNSDELVVFPTPRPARAYAKMRDI